MCEETQEWMAFIATGHHIRVQREVWSNMHRLNINAFSKPTPQSSVVLEKLTIPHPVKKFPALYAIQRFITMFTRACHLCDTIYPVHSISFKIHLSLSPTYNTCVFWMVPFLQVSPQKSCMHFFSPPYLWYDATSHPLLFDHANKIWRLQRSQSQWLHSLRHGSTTTHLLGVQIQIPPEVRVFISYKRCFIR